MKRMDNEEDEAAAAAERQRKLFVIQPAHSAQQCQYFNGKTVNMVY